MHAGRGIGLNLVRERIRDVRGSIKLTSEYGKGATFHVYMPLDVKTAEKAS
jgi:chemotaxis protein histidine kinase CheA